MKKNVQYSIVEIHVYITFELTVETTKLFVYFNVLSILLWFWMVLQPIHWPNQCTTILSADCGSMVVSTRFSLIFHFVFKSYKVTLKRFNIKCYQFNIKKNNWRILQHKMSETLPYIVCVFKWFYSFIAFPLTPLKKEPFFSSFKEVIINKSVIINLLLGVYIWNCFHKLTLKRDGNVDDFFFSNKNSKIQLLKCENFYRQCHFFLVF